MLGELVIVKWKDAVGLKQPPEEFMRSRFPEWIEVGFLVQDDEDGVRLVNSVCTGGDPEVVGDLIPRDWVICVEQFPGLVDEMKKVLPKKSTSGV